MIGTVRVKGSKLLMGILQRMSAVGLLLATLFFAFSLTPSLVPRPIFAQGVVSGLSLTAGYAIGFLGAWLWRYLEIPLPRPKVRRRLTLGAGAICIGMVFIFVWQAAAWQNSVRAVMGMELIDGVKPMNIAVIALVVFAALLALGRAFRRVFRIFVRQLDRVIPRRISRMIGLVASFALFWLVIEGLAVSWLLRGVDRSHQQLDALISDDTEPPSDPMKTGSDASLIDWADLGRQGRIFISTGPTAEQIGAFLDEQAMEPIRVYVGLNAAETPEERARLALAELKRVGGFERSVLLLATPTGTGWIDPASQDTVEYLHRGDIATVAAQYSYLPSPVALALEAEYGTATARAMFLKIYGHWTQLPADERPKLYLHGLSLGAHNSDQSFDAYDIMADSFHGVLWVGPPFRAETWRHLTKSRRPDSPAWLPRFRDGSVVRFMNQDGGLEVGDAPWGPHRVAILQYGSDPITFFQIDSFYREPQWLQGERAPDVLPQLEWRPVVTFLQLVADMLVGGAPPGYGHNYAAEHYIDAWVALTMPAGWSKQDLQRLKEVFEEEPE